jgi:hypothetical protein
MIVKEYGKMKTMYSIIGEPSHFENEFRVHEYFSSS